jgi:hypothetical protein
MSKKDKVMDLCDKLFKKYPLGEFICDPMFSYSGESVSCVVMTDWKSNIYHFEHDPIDELISLLEKLL